MGGADGDGVREQDIIYSPLPSQRKFHKSKARFKGFSGPIGSGKSQALCQETIRLTYLNPGRQGLIGAPTYPMLRDSTQATLLEILESNRIPHELNKGENSLLMKDTRSRVLFRSLDDFERLRGTNLAWFGVDELTYTQEEAWLRLEGRLRDPKAARLCGFGVWTPKGYDWVYRRFIEKPVEGYELVQARAYENRHLLKAVPDYYDRLKSSYDERFFAQEVLGQYLNITGGRVYHAFDRAVHVGLVELEKHVPLLWALDFNVEPMSSLIAQVVGDEIGVYDEIVLARASTREACEEFRNRFPTWPGGVRIYGDASGHSAHSVGGTDYQVIRSFMTEHRYDAGFLAPISNPSVRDRVALVNAKLRGADGVVRLKMKARCSDLIADFEQVTYKEGTGVIDKDRDPARTHLSDALGYMLWQKLGAKLKAGYKERRLVYGGARGWFRRGPLPLVAARLRAFVVMCVRGWARRSADGRSGARSGEAERGSVRRCGLADRTGWRRANLVQGINVEHPEYAAKKAIWRRYRDLYAGGEQLKANAAEYLVRRQKEPGEVWNERLERVFYENFAGSIIDWYAATLFRREPLLIVEGDEGGQRFIQKFSEDSDRKGTTITEFLRRMLIEALVTGRSFVLADFPRQARQASNRAEEDARGASRAYLVECTADQLINWSLDERGNFEWVVLRSTALRKAKVDDPEWRRETNWAYYDKESFRLFRRLEGGDQEAPIELVDSGRHGLARQRQVPLFDLRIPEGLWLMNKAGLLQLEHFNKSNGLAWALTMGLFAMPVVYTDREWDQIAGESYYVQLGPNDRFGWTEPEGHVFQIAADNLSRLEEKIYRVCYLLSQAGGGWSQRKLQSGVSKQRDYAITQEVLRAYGDSVKDLLKRVLRAIVEARQDRVSVDVSGLEEFDIGDFSSELEDAERLLAMGIESKTLRQQVLKKLSFKYLCDVRQEIKDRIGSEIDASLGV